jgi:hypothetical protein
MSWSDDMRCLYCDGKLPLYRKITHGQFCSAAHRKAYWQEQERLAVERLHQTHSSLKAFRSSASVESILGRDPGSESGEMELSGFVRAVLYPQSHGAPRMLLADPLAYDLERTPGKLEWSLPEHPDRSIRSGGPVHPLPEWLNAMAGGDSCGPRAIELAPKSILLEAARPSLELSPLRSMEDFPPEMAGLVGMALFAVAPALQTIAPQALPVRMPRPAQFLRLSIAPEPLEIEPQAEADPPVAEGLFSLSPFFQQTLIQARETALPVEPPLETLAGEPLPAPPPAMLPDHPFVKAFGPRALAGAVRLYGGKAPDAPVLLPANAVWGDVSALERTAARVPVQVSLALLQRQPGLAMGRGSRYPIELRTAGAPDSAVEPIDFPVVPGNVLALAPLALAVAAEPEPELVAQEPLAPEMRGMLPLKFKLGRPKVRHAAPIVSNIATIPQPLRTEPILPSSGLQPLDVKPVEDLMQPPEAETPLPASPAVKLHPWAVAAGFWKLAPRDLKILAFAIPVLLALAFHRELPKVHVAATPSTGDLRKNLETVMSTQWTSMRQAVMDRAAVALDEDFRSGLDDWASRGDATAEWSFDATGFVRPGPLALYRPSMSLADYQVQFLGMIDKKALSWVVRATDFDNYYVIKLAVLKPGPRTTVGLTRYAVIQGKAVDRVDTVVPMEAQPDTLYRVRMELEGDDFSLSIQGETVDSWSEPRLPKGGIGFFTARGEESRVRWVALTHQYDMLGRLCAYLAPYETPTTNGSW